MAGRIQNEDIKSSAELVSAGGTAAQLPNDTKAYVTAKSINKTLFQAITDGDIGGSGAGGGKNYAPNGGTFSGSISNWNVFNTTFSGGVPGTITLTSTKVAIALETTSPLSPPGSLNFQVTTASGSAGNGFISDAMTIDDQDLAKVFQFIANYKVVTGGATMDFSGTSTQTLEWWVYNVGLASWYQPSGFRGMNTSATPAVVAGNFQTDSSNTSNNNQYRLACIVRNAPSGTSTLLFDTIYFGRVGAPTEGFAATDWIQYTPTFTGAGTVTGSTFFSRRMGDSLQIQGRFTAGTTTATQAQITMGFLGANANVTSDSTKVPSLRALGVWNQNQNTASSGSVIMNQSVNYMSFGLQASGSNGLTEQNGSAIWTSGATFTLFIEVPIQGWASGVQISADTDTKVVSANIYRGATQSIANATATKITLNTLSFDTSGAADITTNNRININTSGVYQVSASVSWATNSTGDRGTYIYLNGSQVALSEAQANGVTASVIPCYMSLSLKAGDFIELYGVQGSGGSLNANGGSGATFLSVTRVSGPSILTATESVNARYTSTGSQAFTTSDVQVNFDTKDYDSHSAVTTGATWKFTAPISGKYAVKTTMQTGSFTGVVGNNIVAILYKTGSLFSKLDLKGCETTSSQIKALSGSDTVSLLAGDTLDIRINRDSGLSVSLSGTGSNVHIAIERVGN